MLTLLVITQMNSEPMRNTSRSRDPLIFKSFLIHSPMHNVLEISINRQLRLVSIFVISLTISRDLMRHQ